MNGLDAIIKTEVMNEVFVGDESCPDNTNTYDFFMGFECDGFSEIYQTELGSKWEYQPIDEYGLENIRGLRGLMQSKFNTFSEFHSKSCKEQKMNRDTFMEYFRGDDFSEQLSVDDKIEVFLGSLSGGTDITEALLNKLLSDYEVGCRIEVKEQVC